MERSQVSPYHPDFIREDDEESDEEKNGGVDVGCIPPASARRGLLADDHQSLENRASSSEKREFFPSLWKDDDGSDRSFISGGSGSEEIDDEDDDDDLPLAVNGQVRVRRGSEGYEVKPRAFNLEFEREEEFHRHEDQRRLQELGFGERLDQEGGDRDLNQEEQSWRRSEMERERRELAGGVVLPSELMRRREGERHSGAMVLDHLWRVEGSLLLRVLIQVGIGVTNRRAGWETGVKPGGNFSFGTNSNWDRSCCTVHR